jgi:tRNA G18 (ribose-2'-O)-methylase SpoU|tara:strand:- start:1026 stop:1559 length:534 start_codon:yes stop_codon:yes gene_type:complete
MNVGSLFRSGHAFGASFIFTVNANYNTRKGGKSDTSVSTEHIPFYKFPDASSLVLPKLCKLVGVELIDDAVELPSFRHPLQAAYILGPERGSLSNAILEKCSHTVKIPTKFCINLGLAGAIIMYDRMLALGKFPNRPTTSRKTSSAFGLYEKQMKSFEVKTPLAELNELKELTLQDD